VPTFNHFRLGFRPGLDGLRGIAILGVLACHCAFVWNPVDAGRYLPGAFVTVDVFFALSGFLITSLLLTETNRKGQVSLRGFYRRRALRLLPVLYALMVAQLIYTVVVGDAIGHDLEGLAFIAAYVSNWAIVFHWAQPFGTAQTWSLGVEEQFYFIWPILLIVITKFQTRGRAIVVFAGLIFIAFASRAYIWHTGKVGWNIIYVQTETRLDVLMAGALLAYLLHTGWKPPSWAAHVGQVALLLLILVTAKTYATEAWLYHGGFTVIAFASAAVVYMAVDGTTPIGRLLTWAPLRAIGRRSYSLYIWHYLALLAVARAMPQFPQLERLTVALVITAVSTELSHQIIEKPFLAVKNKTSIEPLPVE
jgi:peptidoglycan/LPS O-acetylase OafA/YrhL